MLGKRAGPKSIEGFNEHAGDKDMSASSIIRARDGSGK